MGFAGRNLLTQLAIAILRKFGSNAHVYTPGAGGVAVSGLQTGNYSLSDGSTGYSAIDGSTGLVLDGAGSVGAALTTLGTYVSVNAALTNGGVLPFVATSSAAGNYGGRVVGALVIGQWYRATLSWSGNTLNRSISADGGAGTVIGTEVAATKSYFFKCTAVSDHYFYAIGAAGAGETITFSSCTMEPVTGIHASQSTGANRPTLRRGMLNLLTYSNDLSNAAHTKSAVSVSGQKIVEDSTTGNHYIADTSTIAAAPYTHAVRVTAAEHTRVLLRENSVTGSASTFDLSNGTVLGNENGASGSIIAVGDGSYICATTRTFSAGSTQFGVFLVPNTGTNFASCSYAGNGSAGLTVNQIGLFTGTLTAQQILSEGGIPLTTAAAASNAGAGRYSFGLNGSTQSLVTASAPFNQNDDWFMGIAFRVDEVAGARVALHAFADATSKGPGLLANVTTGYPVLQLYDGTTWSVIQGNTSCVGQVVVLHATQVSGVRKLWRNGVLVGTDSTVLTPVTCTGLRIGGSGSTGGSLVNGMVGASMAHKGTFSDADALTLARSIAAATPGAPSF